MLTGKCDLKLMVYKKLKEMGVSECSVFVKYKTYGELQADFLAKEVLGMKQRGKCYEIFHECDMF